jgi:hypothetical protein
VCLDSARRNLPSGKIVWRKPGVSHKARFCAFGIYSLMALAFSEHLDLDDENVEALNKFCKFTTTVPHFLGSTIGCDSTVNDLPLYKKLFACTSIDIQHTEESLVVLIWHGQYLPLEVVVFSLFPKKL